MKTHYVKDIRVLSAFQQTIRAMQILILVLRVLAVAFYFYYCFIGCGKLPFYVRIGAARGG